MSTALRPSQIATLRQLAERPLTTAAVGFDMARELAAAGHITIRGNRCYATPATVAAYPGRSAATQRDDNAAAYATLMGRSGTFANR